MATHRDNTPVQTGMPPGGILSGRHKRLVVMHADRDAESQAQCESETGRLVCPACTPKTYARAPSKPVSGNMVAQ